VRQVLVMLKVVSLQLVALILVAVIAGLWVGGRGAISALIGGSAYLIPNLLFVLRLEFAANHGRANVVTFVAGELFKVTATIVTLVVVQRWVDLHWLAMLGGLFAVLQANFFAFLLKT
jgi:ATP synthase protein I